MRLTSSCMALAAVITYIFYIDKVGRRLPICISYTVVTVVLFIIGCLYYNKSAATGNTLVGYCLDSTDSSSQWFAYGNRVGRSTQSPTPYSRPNYRPCNFEVGACVG